MANISEAESGLASVDDGSPSSRDATEEEIASMRHVVDNIPQKVWVSLLNAPGDSAVPGALGLGQSRATIVFNAFYLFSYFVPVPFAIASDTWLGRYTVLCISLSLYFCGTLVQFITSLPSLFSQESGMVGFAIMMVLIGLGVGRTKAAITPFIGDQYPVKLPQIKTLPTGERVIIDRTLTLQYVYNVYYWITNIAALSILASTYLEKERERFPAQGGVLLKAGKVLGYAIQDRFKIDAARPRWQYEKHNRVVPWTDRFVTEIKSGLCACQVMLWFVLFHLGINQMTNNLVSQAGEMELTGFPNDGIQILNPIACVILGPIIQKVLYPTLARYHIPFGPLMRMAMASFTMAATFAYAAGVKKMIYNSGPCYDAPLACPAAERAGQTHLPNTIKVWVQTPVYVILAVSEIFGFVTLSEYSYSKAPKDMRTVVQSMRQLSAGVGSAIGIALGSVSQDPKVLWMYVGLAVSLGLAGVVFWVLMGHLEKDNEDVNTMFLNEDESARGQTEDRIVAAVRSYDKPIHALVTVNNAGAIGTARACQILGFRSAPPKSYIIAGDKFKTREMETDSGGAFKVFNLDELHARLLSKTHPPIEYPVIVKPCMGWGSECVLKVQTEGELIQAYIEGPEVDANFILIDGDVTFFEVADDFPKTGDNAENPLDASFVETSMVLPTGLSPKEIQVTKDSLHQALLRQGFHTGVFHCEGRIRYASKEYDTRDGLVDLYPGRQLAGNKEPSFYLHEINARPGGYFVSSATLLTYGVDYYANHILAAFGDLDRCRALSVPFSHGPQWWLQVIIIQEDKIGVMKTPDAGKETLERHADLHQAVVDYRTAKKKGDKLLGPRANIFSYLAYFSVMSRKSREDCLRLGEKVRRSFTYEIE
ncbi:oligopeptide transporter, putative [Talaromyces stipitatus ATCC 10500]|uniref:Oligopeptide transporter, putative n=1 Tax=Talaromyces stipitatus (strain ATCC 10500 / CBS 375.48 / QM 6759 / NRRL 1006) TaxID=441959 RepID=B8MDA9_TALSN|nr:oligopeptide transporter, putative [Talaromyces stipitatus ATCC 10500]EED17634.1 oligopeptide transporter, putative [Talaromyces stipitatus ATCC 10500]